MRKLHDIKDKVKQIKEDYLKSNTPLLIKCSGLNIFLLISTELRKSLQHTHIFILIETAVSIIGQSCVLRY